MTILAAIAICAVLLVLSFIAPTMSRHPERGVIGVLGFPRRLAAQLPGPLGRWASKPFSSTQKYASKSAQKGRSARSRAPI